MDTNTTDSGLVTITGAEYARLREIDQGPYTFVWKVGDMTLCEPERTIEEARESAQSRIESECVRYLHRDSPREALALAEILASVGFVVRPLVDHYHDRSGLVFHELWGEHTITPVKATINADGVVTIVGP